MTKQTDDIIDRIQGAATALRGVKTQLSPAPPAPVPADLPPPAPAQVTPENYEFAKKVIAELKSNVEALEAEVSKDSKVPEEHAPPLSSGGSKESSSSTTKR
jgi:hypothetical protein